VQSPPPSSPEDATPVRSYPPDDHSDDSSTDAPREDAEQTDPFNSGLHEPEGSIIDGEPPLPHPPPNPFSKTLQDLEQNAQGSDELVASGSKGALDVDSFKRLLLTGYANIPGPAAHGGVSTTTGSQQATTHDGASNTDASSVSRQSIFDAIQETPRTSHEISEPEEPTIAPASPLSNVQPTAGRKPPPPPNSRHGKLIKIELGADSRTYTTSSLPTVSTPPNATPNRKSSSHSPGPASPPLNSDVNKPLPRPPVRASGEEDVDSPFDREAAGKVPESFENLATGPRPPTPPPGTTRARSGSQTSTRTTSSLQRKPAAPPPRRQGHGRTESKPPSFLSDKAEEDPPRSSLESNRSLADSVRVNISSDKHSNAPAPPPRRPAHARQGSSYASPIASSFNHPASPGENEGYRSPGVIGFNPMEHHTSAGMPTVTHNRDGMPKLSPPPPPPARHSSVRRPSSAHSTETGSLRRVSREKEGGAAPPPPPPPPRARGSSKSSLNAPDARAVPGQPRIGSEVDKVDEEPAAAVTVEDIEIEPGAGDDIMEQLKALQKEVEAARKASGSG
jgi:hypothetical protein